MDSAFGTAVVIVIVVCLLICLSCSFVSSVASSKLTNFINNNTIKAIPPLNQQDTVILMNSIEPIIKSNVEDAQNKLSDTDKEALANGINSDINPINIPVYTNIKRMILPKIYEQVNSNINMIPINIRNQLGNRVPEYMISQIIDYEFTVGIDIIRGFEKGVGIWNPVTSEQ